MKPVDFELARPGTIGEALKLIAGSNGAAKLMAGGQTLGPMLNLRFVQPELVVDLSRIAELRRIEERSDAIVLGACTPHAAIEDRRVPDVTCGMMPRIASRIAYRAVRTRGTIGGSLAHADPAADWLSCLSALGARISISGPGGRRETPLVGFVKGALETALGPDELIDGVVIPRLGEKARWGYHKICRKTGEFAEAIGAVVIDGDSCSIVAGATTGRPAVIEVPAAEVLARPPGREDILAMLRAAGLEGDDYEMSIHAVAVRRAIGEAIAA
jgi:aerobic carbon-monoxide dehydrogenase medium subunit